MWGSLVILLATSTSATSYYDRRFNEEFMVNGVIRATPVSGVIRYALDHEIGYSEAKRQIQQKIDESPRRKR
jgi:hypothetical protein